MPTKFTISDEARKLHRESLVVDLHVDPILQKLLFDYEIDEHHDRDWQPSKRRRLFKSLTTFAQNREFHSPFFNHIDVPRMLAGGYSLGAFGIHHWPRAGERGWQNVLNQLNYLERVVKRQSDLVFATDPDALLQAHASGQIGCFAGVEGTHCLGAAGAKNQQRRLDRIQVLFEKHHVRYLTLTHFSRNDAAAPTMGLGADANLGLTRFGTALAEKLNETGMLVDVAHVSHQGVLDACSCSKVPVIASHAGVRSVRKHPRNLNDEALRAIVESGGLVGIMFATNFLSSAATNPTSEVVLQHIDYIVRNYGDDHVALGTDFDGWIPRIPSDMEDAADLPLLTQHMLNHGYSEDRIRKILGMNFLRVWRAALAV